MNLNDVRNYYEIRKLKKPNVWEALGWAIAELGEVYEVLMSFSGGWVRNNPDKHPPKTKNDLAEELGDVILMLLVAGMQEGVDPLKAMEDKMNQKISEITSKGEILTEEQAQEFMK